MYYEFEVKGNIYKLKLTTKNTVELEKRLGCNPLMIFGREFNEIPSVGTAAQIIFYSMQKYQHGIKLEDVYNILDDYFEDHDVTELIEVVTNIYEVSGIMKREVEQEEDLTDEEGKNG